MASVEDEAMVVFVATYASVGDAESDFDAVTSIQAGNDIATGYDAAIVSHDENGSVHIIKTHETPTREGAAMGAGIGLATGLVAALFPAIALTGGLVLGTTAGGAALGAITGHVEAGLSRGDLRDLGETIDEGTAALVFIGAAAVEDQVRMATPKASRVETRKLKGNREDALQDASAAKDKSS